MVQVTLEQAFVGAVQLHAAGRLQEAEQICQRILAQQPAHVGALHVAGVIAHQTGRAAKALEMLGRAAGLKPSDPHVYLNFGLLLSEQGRWDEAIGAYTEALAKQPDFAEAYFNMGVALRRMGLREEAVEVYRRCIGLRQNYPEAHYNLGNLLREMARFEEAVLAYQQAVTWRANYPEALCNLGNALHVVGRLEEAADACRQAIALRPEFADAYMNLGNIQRDLGHLDDAIDAGRKALALAPQSAEAHNNLGCALTNAGEVGDAIRAFREAIAIKPDFSRAHSNLIFSLNYHPNYGPQEIAQELRLWNERHATPLAGLMSPHDNERSPERRLRIGYVSSDFCAHACSFYLVPLIENHDRRDVEIFCYSEVDHPDAVTRRVRASAEHWRSIAGRGDEEVAGQIRADGIDILVDLNLHTERNRLLVFARKPAPIQVTWLGYPGSSGLRTMDYRLTEKVLDPPGVTDPGYVETAYFLPHTFWCYDPLTAEPEVSALPALSEGRVTFGCLNNIGKVNDSVLQVWAQVLGSVKRSRLLLLAHEGRHRQRVLAFLAQRGVKEGQVEFCAPRPRADYLALYHRIDLCLDTFPYNGHTTSFDSFWMGVPVVTLVGRTAVGRAGLSLSRQLGLPELAASTEAEYVTLASEWAGDLTRLGNLRATLRQRMTQSPLMHTAQFARDIEAAYRQMWRNWCAAV